MYPNARITQLINTDYHIQMCDVLILINEPFVIDDKGFTCQNLEGMPVCSLTSKFDASVTIPFRQKVNALNHFALF